MILHAAADYALAAQDRAVAAVAARSAGFQLTATRPDHAAHEPWGLFALIWNPATRPLADRILCGVTDAHPFPSHLNLMLLADALYSLAAFGADGP
jgi:hypothetical protein